MQKKIYILAIFFFMILTFNYYAQNERVIHSQTPTNEPTFEILIDDHPIGLNVEILSIEVKGKLKDISIANIEFLYHTGNADFILVNKKIEILMGYHNQNDTIFEGTTVEHDFEQKPGEPEIITVAAEGYTQKSNDQTPTINLQKGVNIVSYKFKIKENMKITSEILMSGTNAVKLGNKIEITGFGENYDGIYRVVSIKHRLKGANWETKLGMKK